MDKKLEDMNLEELKEYKESLEKEKALRDIKSLELDKQKADEKLKAEEVAKIQTDAVEEYKKAQLAELAKTNPGSVDADGGNEIKNSKAPVNLTHEIVLNKLSNELDRSKAVLGLPEGRQIEGNSYEDTLKHLKSGKYRN